MGLAVAAHLAPVGYSSAFLGLIPLLPACPGLQLSLERPSLISSTPLHPAPRILGCSISVAVWLVSLVAIDSESRLTSFPSFSSLRAAISSDEM